jgi:formate hydrogenlyase subunit 6/NADH:ubiquinone oxidoreductase subunit I
MPYVITNDCIQCGACDAACESHAIKEGPDHSVIDITICIECGVCADSCPFQAIVLEEEAKAG